MQLDRDHADYLSNHSQGRLATIGSDGTPQNKPVGYTYNAELGVIDIGGFNMETSAKYRNVVSHPEVSFVVDDAIGEGASGMRFVEVRGNAIQAEAGAGSPEGGTEAKIIRIRPRRVVSWNVGPGEAKFRSFDLDAPD
jgi:pyridoxamine 5'-phosphate oxidase family protein